MPFFSSLLVKGLLLSAALLQGSALAAGSQTPKTLKAPSVIPSSWKLKSDSSPAAGTPLTFTLVLRGANYDGLTAKMEQIAAAQGEWLTDDELRAFVAPVKADVVALEAVVKKALAPQTLSYNTLGDKLTITTTVEKASKFLAAKFAQYTHDSAPTSTVYRTKSLTLPAEIAEIVTDVYPLATFGQYKTVHTTPIPVSAEEVQQHVKRSRLAAEEGERKKKRSDLQARYTPSSCSTDQTSITCIRDLYGYSSYVPAAQPNNLPRVGVIGLISENYSQYDLNTYLDTFRADYAASSTAYTVPSVNYNGANNQPLTPSTEASLDVQTVGGIIYPLREYYYNVGTRSTGGDLFLLTFQNILNIPTASRPKVITISYDSEEKYFTTSSANTMCQAAQQLVSQGTTIVISSGDYGVDGLNDGTSSCPPFTPTYPSGCPYLLSVGATQSFSPEVMVDKTLAGFTSGAAFSTLFPRPQFQKTNASQVAGYVKFLGSKNSGYYDPNGRAFPDVAAQGSRQYVVIDGSFYLVGGTSASAPVVAGGIALLNELRIRAGKATLGWVNPTFYARPASFTDVKSGGSYGCDDAPSAGFPTRAGWDASSGLGTPLFRHLRAVYGV